MLCYSRLWPAQEIGGRFLHGLLQSAQESMPGNYVTYNLGVLSNYAPRGRDNGSFVEEYWSWVGGICKCLGANAWGFPGVNPSGMTTDNCIRVIPFSWPGLIGK